jgi:phosphoribosylanthranilate isomerase
MSLRIKICGLTRPENAAQVASLGVDYLGLNFWPSSKRFLDPSRGRLVASAARAAGGCAIVGVFVNATISEIEAVHRDTYLDVVQLHGDETESDIAALQARLGIAVWKALPVENSATAAWRQPWTAAAALLLDAPSAGRGGSGLTVDAQVFGEVRAHHHGRRLILAGGLRPDNVAALVQRLRPWAVDAASGVEVAPGDKDPQLVQTFLHAARTAACTDVLPDDHG